MGIFLHFELKKLRLFILISLLFQVVFEYPLYSSKLDNTPFKLTIINNCLMLKLHVGRNTTNGFLMKLGNFIFVRNHFSEMKRQKPIYSH